MRGSENTRTAILDAAENLFAAASFDIVSMRDVAAKARVPLGLINYHFESKEKLFEAIIARRSDELNARRREAFARLKSKPDLRQVIDVFLRPHLELMLEGGAGWRSYGRLLAQTGQQQRWARLITKHFKETQDLVIGAIEQADPRLTKEAVARGYTHMVSVMFGMFAVNDLLAVISRRAHSSRDLERAYDYALPFLVGAFEGLAAACAQETGRKEASRA
ncbi:TetR/AcrR family transcriptional regulator [Pseudorhodoplanes sp.]|uniref:TetR/AcrR family transcriptional regulator n=1 Tax=Pseudorhodoplanes sp. TaxID=1934341 RepID=UPI002B7B53FE|nr:TetR/AcrR family transcriptional regulator [Pseudorhodoplanes sp.]HWV55263.1 TetR/AcrR family transcriptional regulator [Pseudorhodoplanes sp.]